MSDPIRCHYCRGEIDAVAPHTIVVNYPLPGCGETHFCAECVNTSDAAEVRSDRIRELFIALITTDDLDAPRISPGRA